MAGPTLPHEGGGALHSRRVKLAEAHHAGRLQRELTKLGCYPLLVIDEVGYIPFEAVPIHPLRGGREVLYNVSRITV